jgi:hypothetical protein
VPSYLHLPILEFVRKSDDELLGILASRHQHALEHEQRDAWLEEIRILKTELLGLTGDVFLEYAIPRMGKRADALIFTSGLIFVVEFKVHARAFDRAAIDQVHDYALDLKNFHKGSHHRPIVPILVSTRAISGDKQIEMAVDLVASPICVGESGLRGAIDSALSRLPHSDSDATSWDASGYAPTPTIVEAAQALYSRHDVREISRSDAGAINLAATSDQIAEVIERSKALGRKSICFVTGVPGAGKTLAGLNIAAKRQAGHEDEHAVFLSGNGPLVDVLREALARDQSDREAISKSEASRRVRSFVQNIHHFRDAYLDPVQVPIERVVVFDEAQRAWTREQASKFMQQKRGLAGFSQSEPEFLIGVMDRVETWCVIVCLIGGGQEINTGEAGILEWLEALRSHFPSWDIYASATLQDRSYSVEPRALDLLGRPEVRQVPELHLATSMRSFRSETVSKFVAAVLEGNASTAREMVASVSERYPIHVTRDLSKARQWLRTKARGSERFGLLASSGAHRLRAEGIYVKAAVDPPTWFLNDHTDVRSSYYLEEVATEFDVQGLELDWTCTCWDADLRHDGSRWTHHSFRGTNWQKVSAETRQSYLINAYRVLLTRARQGLVIFVPRGNPNDPTRPPDYYGDTFAYLLACGLQPLQEP